MNRSTRHASRVQIESFGCAMNQGECSVAAGILNERGYETVSPPQGGIDPLAGSAVIFTCDVVQATENRMLKRISMLSEAGLKVHVAGCLASVGHDSLSMSCPEPVSLDTMGIDRMRASIESAFPVVGPPAESSIRPLTRLAHIVPVSTGCLGSCTYCITRLARGYLECYDVDRIVDHVRRGVESGKVEVLLTSQDMAAYGMDGSGPGLAGLIQAIVHRVEGRYSIRVGMMNPAHLRGDLGRLLDAFEDARVFKFFHIPMQSGSDHVLEMMGRENTVSEFVSIVGSVRERFPKASISTDVIVGFPGETLGDHRSTMEVLNVVRPDVLNVTRYSPRPGTSAEVMEGRVLQRVQKERSREIVALHGSIIGDNLRARLGPLGPCLVTEIGKAGTLMARDMNYVPVVVRGDRRLLGRTIGIEAESVGITYLVGEPRTPDGRP